jgi:hypothetical protein
MSRRCRGLANRQFLSETSYTSLTCFPIVSSAQAPTMDLSDIAKGDHNAT